MGASRAVWNRVIQLESNNIFRNLAFEASLYSDNERYHHKGSSLAFPSDILIWKSSPCVVIGRFQCAWKECNFTILRNKRWRLARRQSGGGAVFHDLGNLNVSFIEARSVLDRRRCMEFLQTSLQPLLSDWIVQIGSRYDLWLTDSQNTKKLKISGSSSRLGGKVAYHHCTLLCDSDLNSLSDVLSPTFNLLKTAATESLRSPVVNVGIDVNEIEQVVVRCAVEWLAQRNPNGSSETCIVKIREGEEAEYVDPLKFEQQLKNLESWSWVCGASPAFQLNLSEFEPSLTQWGSFMLNCQRGGRVQSLLYTPKAVTSSDIVEFVDLLSDALRDMECRSHIWHGILDRFVAKWQIQRDIDLCDQPYDLVIRSLRSVSDAI